MDHKTKGLGFVRAEGSSTKGIEGQGPILVPHYKGPYSKLVYDKCPKAQPDETGVSRGIIPTRKLAKEKTRQKYHFSPYILITVKLIPMILNLHLIWSLLITH